MKTEGVIKFLAFCACLPMFVILVVALVAPARMTSTAPLRRSDGTFVPEKSRTPDKSMVVLRLVIAELGACFLFVDAVRRDYDAPKGVPIALAGLGLLSFGLGSVIYYLAWGWMPRVRQNVSTAFCQICILSTREGSPPTLMMFNHVAGTRFVGAASRCPDCGSTIKTVWFFFLLPLFPMGSYRVLPRGGATVREAWFYSRKTNGLYWGHVGLMYAIALSLAGMGYYLSMH